MVSPMSILSLALQAVREGPDSSAMPLLRALAVSEERPCIVAVAFDGTLCENQWPGIGRENLPVISAVSLLRELGILVVLWTCREGEDLENALEWCGQRDIRFDAVNENCGCILDLYQWNTRKVHADEYWDDRAVSVSFNY